MLECGAGFPACQQLGMLSSLPAIRQAGKHAPQTEQLLQLLCNACLLSCRPVYCFKADLNSSMSCGTTL